jgi:excisionase family DNA binding protein
MASQAVTQIMQRLNLLTPAEAAEILGVTVGTLTVWRSTRRYPLRYMKLGGRVKYDAAAIEDFLKKRTFEGCAAEPRRKHRSK